MVLFISPGLRGKALERCVSQLEAAAAGGRPGRTWAGPGGSGGGVSVRELRLVLQAKQAEIAAMLARGGGGGEAPWGGFVAGAGNGISGAAFGAAAAEASLEWRQQGGGGVGQGGGGGAFARVAREALAAARGAAAGSGDEGAAAAVYLTGAWPGTGAGMGGDHALSYPDSDEARQHHALMQQFAATGAPLGPDGLPMISDGPLDTGHPADPFTLAAGALGSAVPTAMIGPSLVSIDIDTVSGACVIMIWSEGRT